MISRTLLAASAVALLTAPALAQDAGTPPSTAPSQTQQTSPAPAASGSLQLQPGSNVTGSDGQVLGQLEGVRVNDAGEQELTVRGSDGQLRGVPVGGLRQDGTGVVVAWSLTEYQAAPAIAGSPSASPNPADGSAPDATTAPTTDDEAMDDAAEETTPPTSPQA
jgi:hypothetical protein